MIDIDGRAHLHEGDCFDMIRSMPKVDAVVSDPPYGIEDIVKQYRRGQSDAVKNIANDKDLSVTMAALRALAEGPANDAWFAVFYSCRVTQLFMAQLPPSLTYYGELIWDKKIPGMGNGIRYQHENIALLYSGSEKRLYGSSSFSVLNSFRVADEHPHQKPAGLMRRIVEILDVRSVCDPFMGSGSTGVGAISYGAEFYGAELDSGHFAVAERRIRTQVQQPDMFAAPAQPEIQESML